MLCGAVRANYAVLSGPIGNRPLIARSLTSQVTGPTAAVAAPSTHTAYQPPLAWSAIQPEPATCISCQSAASPGAVACGACGACRDCHGLEHGHRVAGYAGRGGEPAWRGRTRGTSAVQPPT
jgi:hypothetical protein